MLQEIADLAALFPHMIAVEGHTDDVPIHTELAQTMTRLLDEFGETTAQILLARVMTIIQAVHRQVNERVLLP